MNKTLIFIITFVILLILKNKLCILGKVESGKDPTYATWLPVSYCKGDEATVKGLLKNLKEIGITRVYVDVWNQGKVYFNSSTMMALLPDVSGVGNDHLKWSLNAASDLGIEV